MMKRMNIPFSPPDITDLEVEEVEYVIDVLTKIVMEIKKHD